MTNSHKAPIQLKDPSGKIINDNIHEEWKIQLTIKSILFLL